MPDDRVLVSIDAQGVADVRLNRADKMNALDAAMFDGLLAAQERLRAEPGLRAVVLHGEGRAFCAGLDMGRVGHMAQGQPGRDFMLVERSHGIANAPQQAAWGWRELPVPGRKDHPCPMPHPPGGGPRRLRRCLPCRHRACHAA